MQDYLEVTGAELDTKMSDIQGYFNKRVANSEPRVVGRHILHFRYKKYKGKGEEAQGSQGVVRKGRFMFAMSFDEAGSQARDLFTTFLHSSASQAEQLIGPAPRGPLEREASRLLQLIDKKE